MAEIDSNALQTNDRVPPAENCKSTEWFHVGQARKVIAAGISVVVRVVCQKARRTRIEITASGTSARHTNGISIADVSDEE